ncbi:trimeric intracellular cation channel family protein [Gordonia sp. VNK21]|uniref:trimeric intracellular cation channel family protein n=1 Tax=Gordonia sp. VNK21 TaxID=3382483 RepID=UPI0038D35AF1
MSGINDAASTVQHAGELVGVVAFALSGALAAERHRMDIVGVLLVAVATALGGGILRDVLIGNTPPNALTDMSYLLAAVLAGAVVCVWRPPANRYTRWPLDITDAVGLGLFAVTGTVIAHQWGLSAPGSALLGVMTCIGGGVIRDLLCGEVPSVLRPHEYLYAIPALACAATVAVLLRYTNYQAWMGLACAAIAIALRLASLKFGWHGPRPWYHRRAGRDGGPEVS